MSLPCRTRRASSGGKRHLRPRGAGTVVDLERYVPAFLTWIANKLSRGASQHYLAAFDVGIETWRCLVLLAIEDSISAQQVSRIVGMDKASVSRCFKSMQARGLITLDLDATDGRLRLATTHEEGARAARPDPRHRTGTRKRVPVGAHRPRAGDADRAAQAPARQPARGRGRDCEVRRGPLSGTEQATIKGDGRR